MANMYCLPHLISCTPQYIAVANFPLLNYKGIFEQSQADLVLTNSSANILCCFCGFPWISFTIQLHYHEFEARIIVNFSSADYMNGRHPFECIKVTLLIEFGNLTADLQEFLYSASLLLHYLSCCSLMIPLYALQDGQTIVLRLANEKPVVMQGIVIAT